MSQTHLLSCTFCSRECTAELCCHLKTESLTLNTLSICRVVWGWGGFYNRLSLPTNDMTFFNIVITGDAISALEISTVAPAVPCYVPLCICLSWRILLSSDNYLCFNLSRYITFDYLCVCKATVGFHVYDQRTNYAQLNEAINCRHQTLSHVCHVLDAVVLFNQHRAQWKWGAA